MNRMRSLSFPKFYTSRQHEDSMAATTTTATTTPFAPMHSRDSSGASGTSTASSPATPSSNRSHTRWPSSSSSLAGSPDFPVNLTKSALHDLVEDPAERDDGLYDLPTTSPAEPFCICDTPFCQHRRSSRVYSTIGQPYTPEWLPGDDALSDSELPGERCSKRRRSGEHSTDSLTTRISRRWPSFSKRWKDPKLPKALSSPVVRSEPPSRASSVRLRPLRQSLALHAESKEPATPPFSPVESLSEERIVARSRASTLSRPSKPLDIQIPDPVVDPIDRQELASTPLLPPMMAEHYATASEELQSPLQSPSIAEPSASTSLLGTPTFTPEMTALPTPPLSSKASIASFPPGRSVHTLHPSCEIPPMTISEEGDDPWAHRLGHANFHVKPEPYLPDTCTLQTCQRLLDDWETARLDFMRQAAHIGEHYGPTSQTYKFTEQKWAQVDARWRACHERAIADAEASGAITPFHQPHTLAETHPMSRFPSLNDPEQPAKFPQIDQSDIVGPMVQYAKIQPRASRASSPNNNKSPNFLRIFTDAASLLGRRPTLGRR